MNVILHELDKTNRSGNDLSKTLINFDESICDDKLNSPASQKMLDHNDIANSDKKNIKNNINLGNNDINTKSNKVNSNPSSYNVVSCNALNNQHLSSANPFSSPILHNNSNITHRNQKKLISNKDLMIDSPDNINAKDDKRTNIDSNSNNGDNNFNSKNKDDNNSDENNVKKDGLPEKKKDLEKKVIYIVGNSMVKELKGYELAKCIKHRKQVQVRTHTSAKIRCLIDHLQPIIRNNDAEHVILHIRTNDLKYEKNPVQMSHEIIELATKIRDKNIKVSISGITQQNDEFNEKVLLVNEVLKNICESIDIEFINNINIRPDVHLNQSKLHLNRKSNNILISSIKLFLAKSF